MYQYESLLLRNVGRLREALSFQLVAQATDEWSPSKMARLASDYANMGNMTAARNVLNRALQRWPNHSGVRTAQRHIIGFYEKPSQALAVFKTLPDDGSTAIWRNFAEAKAAHSGPVTEAAIPRIREAADEGKMTRETEITMMADLGETKQAVEAANSALDRGQELRGLVPLHAGHAKDCGRIRTLFASHPAWAWSVIGERPANVPTFAGSGKPKRMHPAIACRTEPVTFARGFVQCLKFIVTLANTYRPSTSYHSE